MRPTAFKGSGSHCVFRTEQKKKSTTNDDNTPNPTIAI